MKFTRFAVQRLPDDPLCLRASIGGTAEDGFYLSFRGDPKKVAEMLNKVAIMAGAALPQDKYIDKRGRPQG